MRIYDNGIYRDATAEELAFFDKLREEIEKEVVEMQPTMEERLEKLEKLFDHIKSVLSKIGIAIPEE